MVFYLRMLTLDFYKDANAGFKSLMHLLPFKYSSYDTQIWIFLKSISQYLSASFFVTFSSPQRHRPLIMDFDCFETAFLLARDCEKNPGSAMKYSNLSLGFY